MAEQRVQVRELALPQGVSPTASPVETYVAPSKIQTQPSQLEEFVSALAPAFKANAELTRIERLRDEQEIRNNTRANQLNQMDKAALNLGGMMSQDYTANKETLLNNKVSELEFREHYGKFIDNWYNSLGDISPTVKDAGLRQAQLNLEELVVKSYRPDLAKRADQDLDESFNGALTTLSGVLKPDQVTVDEVGRQLDSTIAANPKGDLKATRQYWNDKLVDYAVEQAKSNPFDPVIQFTMKKILKSGRYVEQRVAIEKAQAVTTSSTNKVVKQQVTAAHVDAVAQSVLDGTAGAVNLETKTTLMTPEGVPFEIQVTAPTLAKSLDELTMLKVVEHDKQRVEIEENSTLSVEERETKLKIHEQEFAELKRGQFAAYATIGKVPPEYITARRDANASFFADLTNPEAVGRAELAFTKLEELESYFGERGTSKLFEGDKKLQEMFEVIKGAMEVNLPFKDAIDMAQKFDPEGLPEFTITDAELSEMIDPNAFGSKGMIGIFTFTNLDEISNMGVIKSDVRKLARIRMGSGLGMYSEKEAMDYAVKKVVEDYQVLEQPDGTYVGIKAESGSHTERSVKGAETALNIAMDNPEFVKAIQENFSIQSKTVARPTSTFGVESVSYEKVAGFTLNVSNSLNNSNQLDVYVIETDSDGKMMPTGFRSSIGTIDMTTIDKQIRYKFIDNMIANHQQTVAPITASTPESELGLSSLDMDEEVLDFTPTTSKSFAEMSSVDEFLGDRLANMDIGRDMETAFAGSNAFAEEQRNAILDRAREKLAGKGLDPTVVDETSSALLDSIAESISDVGKSLSDTASDVVDSVTDFFTDDTAEASEVIPSEVVVPSSEISERTFTDSTVDNTPLQGDNVADKATNLIQVQEDFKANPYPDGKNKSVGYGFYLPSLEADEKALIKDVNNITEPEAQAVMKLKVSKITKFMQTEIDNFDKLPESTQLGITSMAFQLGRQNVRDEWPKFMTAIKKASGLPTGSTKQLKALEEASKHMLFNVKNGKQTKTGWHTQTPNRANEMARFVKGT
jgi:GH24 family phage-related lysozyme (muramidase)